MSNIDTHSKTLSKEFVREYANF